MPFSCEGLSRQLAPAHLVDRSNAPTVTSPNLAIRIRNHGFVDDFALNFVLVRSRGTLRRGDIAQRPALADLNALT